MCPLQLTSECHTCEMQPWWLFMPWISPWMESLSHPESYSTTCRHTIISGRTQVNSKTSCPVKSLLDVLKSLFQPVILVWGHSRMSWLVSLAPCPHLHHPGHRTEAMHLTISLKQRSFIHTYAFMWSSKCVIIVKPTTLLISFLF